MKKIFFEILLLFLIVIAIPQPSFSQDDWKQQTGRVGVMLGINEIFLTDGYVLEANYTHKRFIFALHHLISIDHAGEGLRADMRRQEIALHNPYITGISAGYRLTNWLNVRLEPRFNRYEFYYATDNQKKTDPFLTYNTISCGIGVHAFWLPFKNKENALKGIAVIPKFHYWPNIWDSRNGKDFNYFNKATSQNETIPVLPVGIFHTPFIGEVALGYFFNLKKQ